MVFVYDALTIFDYEKISDISYLPQISKEGLTIIKTELFLKKIKNKLKKELKSTARCTTFK